MGRAGLLTVLWVMFDSANKNNYNNYIIIYVITYKFIHCFSLFLFEGSPRTWLT